MLLAMENLGQRTCLGLQLLWLKASLTDGWGTPMGRVSTREETGACGGPDHGISTRVAPGSDRRVLQRPGESPTNRSHAPQLFGFMAAGDTVMKLATRVERQLRQWSGYGGGLGWGKEWVSCPALCPRRESNSHEVALGGF